MNDKQYEPNESEIEIKMRAFQQAYDRGELPDYMYQGGPNSQKHEVPKIERHKRYAIWASEFMSSHSPAAYDAMKRELYNMAANAILADRDAIERGENPKLDPVQVYELLSGASEEGDIPF